MDQLWLQMGRCMDMDVETRIFQASEALRATRRAVFLHANLRLEMKKKIYQACVLSVLLYGSECSILQGHRSPYGRSGGCRTNV